MNNEDTLAQVLTELKRLNLKIEELFEYIKSVQKPGAKKAPKSKLPPLAEAEIKQLQDGFISLYQRWMNGNETEVRLQLEAMTAEEIRRFGDANNLNITSKMSKEKVMQLISIRFREKKLLTQNVNVTKPLNDSLNKSHPPAKER
jgi:hypothetical protein